MPFLLVFCVSSCLNTLVDTNACESELWDSVSCCNSGSEKTTAALHSVYSTADLAQETNVMLVDDNVILH